MVDLDALQREIQASAPDGIWVIDLEGNTLYANRAIAKMYGIAEDAVGDLRVQDTLDEVGREQFEEHLRAVRAGEGEADFEVEVHFVDRAGNGRWITVHETPLMEDGKLVGLLHRTSDRAERRRVLEELTRNRAQLEEAQRIAKLGSWVYDVATGQLTVLSGDSVYVPGQQSMGSFEGFLDLVHPDDLDATIAVTGNLLDGRREFAFDTRVRDGEEGWVALRVRGVIHRDPAGEPVSIAGTHQDVTEMRAAEVALRDEVAQAALMRAVSATANGATSLAEALQQACPLMQEHSTWQRCSLFLLDDQGELVEVNDTAADIDRQLAREITLDGRLRWSEDGATLAVPVSVDGVVHAVCTVTCHRPPDRCGPMEEILLAVALQLGRVAEREEAQRSLAAARDEAMSASRQKSQFLATMSHEVRTPLNGIIGLNDLLLRSDLDPAQQRLASGVHLASRTLLSVINDVLDFSKLDGRSVELEQVDVDVRSMLDQVVRVMSGSSATGDVELIVSCHHEVPATVLGDPTRLSQVLLNLVSNAVKFSEGGQVLVKALVESLDGEQVLLRFEVHDTGIGIDPEHVARLFEPFTQGDASTTRRYGGTGLGLAIAREIVAALGGDLDYRPNPTGGSIFTFTAACGVMAGQTSAIDDYARTWLSGRRILIADAGDRRSAALAGQLTWWHLRAVRVPDAAAAREALAASLEEGDPFDAVLIDLDAAGTGLDLVGEIAAESAYDRITMLALGAAAQSVIIRLRRAGVSVVLGRPLPGEVLRGTLLEQVAGVPAQPTGHATTALQPTERARILVVEDNPVNQLVAAGVLESLGYAVEISPDGAHALDVLGAASFDAILMDVQMPVLDGYATTRTLREREAGVTRVPIIAMTAAAVDGERERCLDAGMDDFLTKPIEPTILAATLGRWVTTSEPIMPDPTAAELPPTGPMPGLDTERLDMLRDLDPGDTTYIDRAIGNFQVNSAAAVASIRQLVADNDAAGLRATAHKIAGSALNLGIARSAEAARALEQIADQGTTEGAAELLDELDAAMAEGREQLLAYQRTYSD